MAQSVASANGMAFSNNSRSFTTTGMTATSDNKNKSAVPLLNNTFGSTNKAWGADNIWATGTLTNGFKSRVTTRDNSGSRDISDPNATDNTKATEGKTGSGQLVESSVCDDWRYKTSWGAKRSLPLSGPTAQVRPPNGNASQQRSVSNAGLSQISSNASQNPASLASRPTANALNSAPAQSRSTYAPNYPSGFNGTTAELPPQVYTKFDRPTDPSSRKPRDSAKGGLWSDLSPTDERNAPYGITSGNRNSIPNSRNGSQPPSSHSDDRPFFSNPDYSRPAQMPSHNTSRTPSMSSQGNESWATSFNSNADSLGREFNRLSIHSSSRPPSSYKSPTNPNVSFYQYVPSQSGSSTFFPRSEFRPFNCGNTSLDRMDDPRGSRNSANFAGPDSYTSPNQSPPNPGRFNAPFSHPRGTSATAGQGQPSFITGNPAIGYDFVPANKSKTSWQAFNSSTSTSNRNSGLLPDSASPFDPRFPQLFEPPMRNLFPPMYDPYNLVNQMGIQAHYSNLMHTNFGGLSSAPVAHNAPAGEDVQSSLLYEFKSNSKPKRYELKDIYDHIAEFSGDQHGSRFIQTKLETATSEEKERVFREIEPNAIPLMTDVFGNYVIQKFFEHGDQNHKKILANKMKGQVLNLSLQMYGCRVVQKALDHVLVDQQAQLINELKTHVLRCVKDQNGNHVIQKAIERCPSDTIGFIIQAFQGQVQHLGVHPYGCRVIQRCLEHCQKQYKDLIMGELMEGIQSLVSDQYGNYVVQHVVVHDSGPAKQQVLDVVAKGLEAYSKHKFASNVVEKCLEKCDYRWRREVVFSLANGDQRRCEGGGVLVGLIKDSYGNYVVQKLLDTLGPEDYGHFHDILLPAINQAKRHGCSKQVVSIEKKMHSFPPPARHGDFSYNHQQHHHVAGAYHHALPLQTPPFANNSVYGSAPATPPLTTGDTQSRQSSAIPSINGDAIEGAMTAGRKWSELLPNHDGGSYLR